ncbi:MAG: hypothetical protein J6C46_09705 [Clostridia bacterium]|nr:hypothetical protein [Clostridia bacterium]
MIIEKIYFNATDELQLFGLLHKSEKTNDNEKISGKDTKKRVVLSIHGMTSNCFKKREDIFAEEFTKNGIDYFCFNNRGADIIEYFERVKKGKLLTRIEGGSATENFEECYHDIKGAILMLLEKGYDDIYLQGHSYGSAKAVYTYNKFKQNMELDLLSHIKCVTLLSIVDVPRMCRSLLREKYNNVVTEVKQMINEKRGDYLITREYFLHPMTANNFLYFNKIGGPMDLVPFGDEKPNLVALSNIDCPLLMMWGKERDLIMQKPEQLEEIIRNNVEKSQLEIKFIEGTGHNYRCKEKETAEEMLKFLNRLGT